MDFRKICIENENVALHFGTKPPIANFAARASPVCKIQKLSSVLVFFNSVGKKDRIELKAYHETFGRNAVLSDFFLSTSMYSGVTD